MISGRYLLRAAAGGTAEGGCCLRSIVCSFNRGQASTGSFLMPESYARTCHLNFGTPLAD